MLKQNINLNFLTKRIQFTGSLIFPSHIIYSYVLLPFKKQKKIAIHIYYISCHYLLVYLKCVIE